MGHGPRFGMAGVGHNETYWFAVANAPEGEREDDPLAVVRDRFCRFGAHVEIFWRHPGQRVFAPTFMTATLARAGGATASPCSARPRTRPRRISGRWTSGDRGRRWCSPTLSPPSPRPRSRVRSLPVATLRAHALDRRGVEALRPSGASDGAPRRLGAQPRRSAHSTERSARALVAGIPLPSLTARRL